MKNFKVNLKEEKRSVALEVLFDISVVAVVSLIFNGFIINDRSSVFDQKYFMAANAALLSTHWYSNIFFRQRFEKKNSFFRLIGMIQVLSLIIMAVGIDLMVFRENSRDNIRSFEFLRWSSMIIFLVGFIFSRMNISLLFFIACISNRKIIALIKLTIFKSISRFVVAILASIHITIVITLGIEYIPVTTYTFIPIYLLIEFLGNIAFVTQKNIDNSPRISFSDARTRYSKVNLLYISSFFVSGTIQFAFYFKNLEDLKMLWTLFGAYIFGFSIWWAYMDRVHRFDIKRSAKNWILYSFINIIQAMALVVTGSMIINAHKQTNIDFIIPSVYFALSLLLISFTLASITFDNRKNSTSLRRAQKLEYIFQVIPFVILFCLMGTLSIYIDIPQYVLYLVVSGSFTFLNVMSRIVIDKNINNLL